MQFTGAGNEWTVADGNNLTGSLVDFMFRRYNPTQGRWISPDPAGLSAVDPSNPQSWNRYVYALSSPFSFTDSLGLDDDCAGPCAPFSYFVGGCEVDVTYSNEPSGDGHTYDMPSFAVGCNSGSPVQTSTPSLPPPANNGPGFLTKLNTCVVKNAKNYSIGGVANLISNTQIPGSSLASNSITDAYILFTGQDGMLSSVWSATKTGFQWAAAASPPVMTNGPNSFTTINPALGSPQAILGNGTNYQGLWASAKRFLKSGAELKLAIDAGLTGALVLNCSLGQIQ